MKISRLVLAGGILAVIGFLFASPERGVEAQTVAGNTVLVTVPQVTLNPQTFISPEVTVPTTIPSGRDLVFFGNVAQPDLVAGNCFRFSIEVFNEPLAVWQEFVGAPLCGSSTSGQPTVAINPRSIVGKRVRGVAVISTRSRVGMSIELGFEQP